MVITLLLAIKLKDTTNGNPTNDFHWRQKSTTMNVVQCSQVTPPKSLEFFTVQIYIVQREI